MADFLTKMTELLTALAVSTADVKRGPLTDDAADETALIDYTGAGPELTFCGVNTRNFRLAIQARRANRLLACARVEAIHLALIAAATPVSLTGYVVQEIVPQGEPSWLDEDANGRTVYTASYEIRVKGP